MIDMTNTRSNIMKKIVGSIVLMLFGILGMSGVAAAAPAALSMTSTMASYVVPQVPGSYTLKMWHSGTLEGSITGSTGTLSLKVPYVTPCTFQLDVQRDGSYYTGRRFTLTTCGPVVPVTTTTMPTTTTTVVPVTTTTSSTTTTTVPSVTCPGDETPVNGICAPQPCRGGTTANPLPPGCIVSVGSGGSG